MTRQQEAGPLTTADLAAREPQDQAAQEPTDQPPRTTGAAPEVTLLEPAATSSFQQRWADTQTRFVDDPRGAVKEADALVADLMRSLAQGFADHRSALEEQWRQDAEPDTEQLRVALQRYRLLFSRLLSA